MFSIKMELRGGTFGPKAGKKGGWGTNVCRSGAAEPLLTVIATLAWLHIRWGLWGIDTAVAKVV